jgi:bifunctional polynucleotide phosphatase/kinase
MWDMLTTGSPTPEALISAIRQEHGDVARKLIEIGAPLWPGTSIDLANSYYVGDAAGRPFPTLAGRNKDFSCSDRKFAANIGIDFHTPEAFFLEKPEAGFGWDGFGPDELEALRSNRLPEAAAPLAGSGGELIVMVGFPGSGKSYFARRYLEAHGYVRVNRDSLGDMKKCEVVTGTALAAGKRVVVDNTSPDVAARAAFLKLAATHGVPARAFVMTAGRKLAMHLNTVRSRLGIKAKVPDVAIHTYNKKFTMPTCDEGFAAVVSVPVVPDFTGLPDGAEAIFYQLS